MIRSKNYILDFTHVYIDEDIQQESGISLIDCSDIEGCDLYCSKAAEIEIKKRIAFLTGNTKLYKDLSAYELLTMCGNYYHMSKKDIKDRIKYLNKTFDMESFLYQRIGTLSTGQTQRVSIARCLMHDPKYYILDEPTSGLDIISSKVILDTIKDEKDKGKCILYSTHYMEEAESICDRVVLMNNGKIITIGTPEEIKKKTNTSNLREAFFALTGGDNYE